jgi:RimJ/RimL family protein N-acetyltransferase
LTEDPDAFGSTLERDAARPDAEWEAWAAASEAGEEQRTFVLDDERGGPFAGLAMVARDAERPGSATIYSMWVAPAARGATNGLFLCEMCCRWAVERGLGELRLAVFAENGRARRAYANAGFAVEDAAAIRTADGRTFEELRLVRAIGPDGIV